MNIGGEDVGRVWLLICALVGREIVNVTINNNGPADGVSHSTRPGGHLGSARDTLPAILNQRVPQRMPGRHNEEESNRKKSTSNETRKPARNAAILHSFIYEPQTRRFTLDFKHAAGTCHSVCRTGNLLRCLDPMVTSGECGQSQGQAGVLLGCEQTSTFRRAERFHDQQRK
jgi:hypothetical protein